MSVGLVLSKASLLGLLPLHVVFALCTRVPSVSLCVLISSSYKDTSQIGLGPTLMGCASHKSLPLLLIIINNILT